MSSVVPFRSIGDRKAEEMIGQMSAIVDGQPTMTGINACLQTLAALIVGYGHQYGGTAELAHNAGDLLASMVDDLASDLKSQIEGGGAA